MGRGKALVVVLCVIFVVRFCLSRIELVSRGPRGHRKLGDRSNALVNFRGNACICTFCGNE